MKKKIWILKILLNNRFNFTVDYFLVTFEKIPLINLNSFKDI